MQSYFLFPRALLFLQPLLGVSGYSYLLLPVETLFNSCHLQELISVLLTQPLTHHDLSNPTLAYFIFFFFFCFLLF